MLTLAPMTLGVDEDILAVIGIPVIAMVIIVLAILGTWTIRSVLTTRQREMTRREIAAYVAEGTIAPEDAAKILNDAKPSDFEAKLGNAVSWGTVSPEKAERLIRAHRENA